jgi:hypothetical protein
MNITQNKIRYVHWFNIDLIYLEYFLVKEQGVLVYLRKLGLHILHIRGAFFVLGTIIRGRSKFLYIRSI